VLSLRRRERIVMCPVATCQLLRNGLCRRLVQARRQQFYCPSLNLSDSLLADVGQNKREVKNVSHGFRVARSNDTCSWKPEDLWINRAKDRELTHDDLIRGERNERST